MNEEKLEKAIELTMHTRRLQKSLFESRIKTTGLYGTQHRILMYLSCRHKSGSQKELADHLQITPAAVTGALQKLEADGYIGRSLGHDNRFNEIEITEKGSDVVRRSKEIFDSVERSVFDGFTDDELDVYIQCLEKLRKNIKLNESNFKEDNQ